MFKRNFKELGNLPLPAVKIFFITFVPRKFANMMGVLIALCFSSLLHEYPIIGQFNIWTDEQLFVYEKKKEITKSKGFSKWVLLLIINFYIYTVIC
jgi:hypothetical protein